MLYIELLVIVMMQIVHAKYIQCSSYRLQFGHRGFISKSLLSQSCVLEGLEKLYLTMQPVVAANTQTKGLDFDPTLLGRA
jgi:hypothetical protein